MQVAECTAAGVAPPDNWAAGFHALVLGPGTLGTLRLLVGLLQRRPHLLSPQVGWCAPALAPASTAAPHTPACLACKHTQVAWTPSLQILPPLLCDVVTALACHPVVATAAPELQSWARQCLPCLCPAAAARLEAVAELGQQQARLETAVQQLARAPTAALAAACCLGLQQQLPALELQSEQAQESTIAACMRAAVQHGGSPAAATLAAALLLHHQPTVRSAALEALAGAAAAAQPGSHLLILQPAVVGSLVMALGAEHHLQQQLAASMLQAAVRADRCGCGRALLPWEAWLLCHATHPATGPAVASTLQAVAGQKRTLWQRLLPVVLGLFHGSLPVVAEAAQQLYTALVQRQPAAAAVMLFCPLPFDGLLSPAGTAVERHSDAAKAAAAAAAQLFTAADVQSLLAVVSSPFVQPDLAAAALGQLAQVAGDERFGVLLTQEPGGLRGLVGLPTQGLVRGAAAVGKPWHSCGTPTPCTAELPMLPPGLQRWRPCCAMRCTLRLGATCSSRPWPAW